MFLADVILIGLDNVSWGLVIYPKRIHLHTIEELPFMVTDNIMIKLVAKGASCQEAYQGYKNHLIERIKDIKYFKPI